MRETVSEDRVLMIISDSTIHGTTRLQKYGFLLSKQYEWELRNIASMQAELKFYDDWMPFWYGPYSESLDKDVKKCAKNGTVSMLLMDEALNKYQYSLTIKGRAVWRGMLNRFHDGMPAIDAKIRNLQKIGLETLLSGVYSAYPEYTKRSVIKDRVGG